MGMLLHESSQQRQSDTLRKFSKHLERLVRKDTDHDVYRRFNGDRTRMIQLYRDCDCQVERVGLYSVHPTGETFFPHRIMEIVRGGEHGDYHYMMIIESIPTDMSQKSIEFAHYMEDGVLHITGGGYVFNSSPLTFRQEHLSKGHFMTVELIPQINFGETAKRLLINAINPDPSFDTPVLIPFGNLLRDTRQGEPGSRRLGDGDLLFFAL